MTQGGYAKLPTEESDNTTTPPSTATAVRPRSKGFMSVLTCGYWGDDHLDEDGVAKGSWGLLWDNDIL